MDREIRDAIRKVQNDPTDAAAVLLLILLLMRAGRSAEIAALLAQLGIARATIEAAMAELPGFAEVMALIARVRQLTEQLRRALEIGNPRSIERILRLLRAAVEQLQAALQQYPHLQALANRAQQLVQNVYKLLEDITYFAKTLPASAPGPILVGAGEVLFIFAAGLLLPASKMGELSIEWPIDKGPSDFPALLEACQEHVRKRDDYTHGPNWTKLRELMNSASALSNEISHFLPQHPADARKSTVEAMQRQVEAWIEQYYNGVGPAALPETPPPPAQPPAPPTTSHPSEPLPPAVAKPPTLAWLEGEDIRRLIQLHKEWIRKWKKKRNEAKPWEEQYKKDLDKAIDGELAEIEKLRKKAAELGQSTGEEWDEPLDDPPPPPFDQMTVTFIEPVTVYVNKKTGEKRVFKNAKPPTSEDWVEVRFDFTSGQWNIRWRWVPQDDPETGRRTWNPGWILID